MPMDPLARMFLEILQEDRERQTKRANEEFDAMTVKIRQLHKEHPKLRPSELMYKAIGIENVTGHRRGRPPKKRPRGRPRKTR